jgi:uncharacterized protein (TIGR02996 family)
MSTHPTPSREPPWRWPHEPPQLLSAAERAAARTMRLSIGWPDAVRDQLELRRAVVERPDDDAPRHAYAAWMLGQEHEFARTIGAFITAQLRVAEAYRGDPRADVLTLRNWRADQGFVAQTDFRAGDALRPWFLDDLSGLLSQGLVGWPQVYRGFVERVSLRARRFLQLADELFDLAPIRYLVLIEVAEVAAELADSPHLARVRSLSLPVYSARDPLTDGALQRLVGSPHLGNLAHLRLVHQAQLTPAVFKHIVTARTLPQLSCFEVFTALHRGRATLGDAPTYDPRGRAERILRYDTPIAAVLDQDWIAPLERALGYVPCLHPEEHYGRHLVDLEAVVQHPIALDPDVVVRRGRVHATVPVHEGLPPW